MKSGRVNSKNSLDTASRTLRSFEGSWQAMEQAATRDEDGVFVIRRDAGRLDGEDPAPARRT
jgi:hypothetical protein